MTITDKKTVDDEQRSMYVYFVILKPRNCEEMILLSQVLKLQNNPSPQCEKDFMIQGMDNLNLGQK